MSDDTFTFQSVFSVLSRSVLPLFGRKFEKRVFVVICLVSTSGQLLLLCTSAIIIAGFYRSPPPPSPCVQPCRAFFFTSLSRARCRIHKTIRYPILLYTLFTKMHTIYTAARIIIYSRPKANVHTNTHTHSLYNARTHAAVVPET